LNGNIWDTIFKEKYKYISMQFISNYNKVYLYKNFLNTKTHYAVGNTVSILVLKYFY